MWDSKSMIEKDITKIVPQIPGESDASYCRLIIMLKKGFKTLKELHEYLQQENHRYYVTFDTIRHNSAKDNWIERIKKYDQLQEQELKEEMEQTFQKLNKTSIQEMAEFLEDLHTLRKDVMKRFHNPSEKFNSSSALRALNDYIHCYGKATEIYYINTRHNLIPNEQENNKEVNDQKLEDFGKIINGV